MADDPPLAALVVDDEAELAHEVASTLRSSGIPAVVAHSGVQAREMLDRDPLIGAIVTDVGMPGGDGFSLARRIMAEAQPDLARRVVIMTGQSRLDHATAALRAGAFDYIRKPFTADDMIDAVDRALAAARAQRADHARRRSTLDQLAQARAQSEHLMFKDPVTQLPNEVSLDRALRAPADGARALLMIRLTGLQFLDAAGSRGPRDATLVAAARRLGDLVGRNEVFALREPAHFAVLLRGARDGDALTAAHAVTDALAVPLAVEGQAVDLRAAVGVAEAGCHSDGPPLDACAQVAMTEAVRLGGARVVAFSSALHGDALRRLRISLDLPRAVAESQLQLHYQPLRTPDLQRLGGYEALLRWNHPALGAVRPDEFIAAAEETGAIIELGEWTARTAVAQVARWRALGQTSFYVGVNVSGRQFLDSEVAGLFAGLLAEYGVPSEALLVEVTETVAIGDSAAAELDALRAMGLRIALDDFGAGFSSLGALRRLPADVVKFDRSLLPDGARSDAQARFYSNLVAAIRGLGFQVVAEGIETEAHRILAASAGADLLQGYRIGRPAPA